MTDHARLGFKPVGHVLMLRTSRVLPDSVRTVLNFLPRRTVGDDQTGELVEFCGGDMNVEKPGGRC